MYVTYGNKNLSQLGGQSGNSYVASFSRRNQTNSRGTPDLILATMKVAGEICVDTSGLTAAQAQAAVEAAVADLEGTLALQGKDVAFRQDNGAPTSHQLPNSTSIGGVRLGEITYSDTGPAEFATGRKWSFEAFAYYDAPDYFDVILYQETFTLSGGGPRYAWKETATGDPVRFQVAAQTVGTLVQSGQIVGRSDHLPLPLPIDPDNYQQSKSSASESRPRVFNGVPKDYQRSWNFVHEKAGPYTLFGPGGV